MEFSVSLGDMMRYTPVQTPIIGTVTRIAPYVAVLWEYGNGRSSTGTYSNGAFTRLVMTGDFVMVEGEEFL